MDNMTYEICPAGHFFTQEGVMPKPVPDYSLGERLDAVSEICSEYCKGDVHSKTGKTEAELREIMIAAGLATEHEFKCVDLYDDYIEMIIGDGPPLSKSGAEDLLEKMRVAWGVGPQQGELI